MLRSAIPGSRQYLSHTSRESAGCWVLIKQGCGGWCAPKATLWATQQKIARAFSRLLLPCRVSSRASSFTPGCGRCCVTDRTCAERAKASAASVRARGSAGASRVAVAVAACAGGSGASEDGEKSSDDGAAARAPLIGWAPTGPLASRSTPISACTWSLYGGGARMAIVL
jgi:hypothetical protein